MMMMKISIRKNCQVIDSDTTQQMAFIVLYAKERIKKIINIPSCDLESQSTIVMTERI
jgi:hypothetical protein